MEIVQEADLASLDDFYEYPFGLVDFTLTCGGTAGGTATIKFYWYGISSMDQLDTYRKFGADAPGSTNKFYKQFDRTDAIETIMYDDDGDGGAVTADILTDVYTVTYTLTDDLIGDDSDVDAEIIDPTG